MAVCIEVLLLIGALVLFFWFLTSKPNKYPPGPIKWPIVGNGQSMKGAMYRLALRMQQQYGDVVGLFDFNTPVVVISGLEAIREACFRADLSGRPHHPFHKIMDGGKLHGIVSTDGEIWQEQRRFTLQHLRDLGFGKRNLESIAHEEIKAVFEDIDEISGGSKNGFPFPVNFQDILGGTSINVLWHIMAGKRYEHRDPEFKQLIAAVKKFFQDISTVGAMTSFSFLAKLFPNITGLSMAIECREPIDRFIQDEIDSHKRAIDFDHPRDFIDVYLSEIEKKKNDPLTTFTEGQLRQVCFEMFVAGTDTTLHTLSFAILYMVLYPDAQKKVQQELDKFVGKDRLPTLDDRTRLPYVDATINEILRCSTIAPLAVPHNPLTTESWVQ